MMKNYTILTINPGSTSTKVTLYKDEVELFSEKVVHTADELAKYKDVNDQLAYRSGLITKALEEHGFELKDIDAFVGRGGGLMPCEGGTYEVNELMLMHAKDGQRSRHPAVLGTQLADTFAKQCGGKAFMVDSPDVDELEEVARITGIKGVYRIGRFHTLNHKRTGIIAAKEMGGKFNEMNFIIAHLGGGVSVTAHKKGRAIDATDQMGGDSPMAPTRSGIVPGYMLIELCFSGKYTKKELMEKLTKNGGLISLLGTSEMKEVSELAAKGDEKAALIIDVFVYQIAKYIGSMAAVLDGNVDAILLTGGIAYDEKIINALKTKIGFIAPVRVYPGEHEMEAMRDGALRILRGEEKSKQYTGKSTYPDPIYPPIEI